MNYTPYSDKLNLSKITVADVRIAGRRQRISWIRTEGLSVSLVVSQEITGQGKLRPPMLIASLMVDESKENVKALCRDYVRRQNDPALKGPIPLRRLKPAELRPDEEVEFDAPEPVLFGAPR